MAQFRKKPVVVDAIQFTGDGDNQTEVLDFMATRPKGETPNGIAHIGGLGWVVMIHTLEGVMHGNIGDWIIRGVRGELYPCKPDIFTATYESVE